MEIKKIPRQMKMESQHSKIYALQQKFYKFIVINDYVKKKEGIK